MTLAAFGDLLFTPADMKNASAPFPSLSELKVRSHLCPGCGVLGGIHLYGRVRVRIHALDDLDEHLSAVP